MNKVHKGVKTMPKILANVKDDICRTTRRMLEENGYGDLNIRAIAGRCGIGMGTIYNYFRSKEEIVAEIVLEDWNLILRRMDQANRQIGEPMKRLSAVFALLQEYISGFHGTWMQMNMADAEKPDQERMRCRRHDYRRQLAERILASAGMEPPVLDAFRADLIARLFLSYSPEPGFHFEKIEPAITGILLVGRTKVQAEKVAEHTA